MATVAGLRRLSADGRGLEPHPCGPGGHGHRADLDGQPRHRHGVGGGDACRAAGRQPLPPLRGSPVSGEGSPCGACRSGDRRACRAGSLDRQPAPGPEDECRVRVRVEDGQQLSCSGARPSSGQAGNRTPLTACSAPPAELEDRVVADDAAPSLVALFAVLDVGVRLVDWICGHARRGRTDTTVACRRSLRRVLARPAGSHGDRSDRATLRSSLVCFGLNRTFDPNHCALLTLSVISGVRVGGAPTPGAPRHEQPSTRRGGALRLTFDEVVGRS
jgi:hypothetical protein